MAKKNSKVFVGVDLGGTSMRAGVVTKDGVVLALAVRLSIELCYLPA
jgi:predicted NBD/HSP70 family sugar kinase